MPEFFFDLHPFRMTDKRLCACILVIVLVSMAPGVFAADVYASISSDGSTRWATQALDTSYAKVISQPTAESPPATTPVVHPAFKVDQVRPHSKRSAALSPLIHSAALRYGLEPQLLMALVEIESGFNPQAISPKGARGLMQLMPATAMRYGMRNVQELHNPARNLDMGARHLKDLLVLHGGHWALAMAAYNAGQGAVAKHGQRIPRYTETMLYVPTVLALAARNTPAPE